MKEHGHAVREDRVEQGWFSFRSGFEAAERLLDRIDRPTAVFASNDDMALGVMAVANRLRLEVPQTLSVAGFDDTPGAKVVWPQLTTVRQPIQAMADAAVQRIVAPGSATADDGGLFAPELVVRASTAAPRT
jgi:LacI family transcriptional regulator